MAGRQAENVGRERGADVPTVADGDRVCTEGRGAECLATFSGVIPRRTRRGVGITVGPDEELRPREVR